MGRLAAASDTRAFRGRLSVTALTVFVLMSSLAGLASWATRSTVRDQEKRLLKERASEIGLVFTSSLSTLTTGLDAMRGTLQITGASASNFAKAAAPETIATTRAGFPTMALVQREGTGSFRVLRVAGRAVSVGQILTGERATALGAAQETAPTSTEVLGSGSKRSIGFALEATGIPGFARNVWLYREVPLGRLSAGRQAGSAAFHEVDVVLYASTTRQPSQLLISTAGGPIPSDGARFIPQQAGASTWTLGVRPKASLVGGVAANAWWEVFAAIAIAGLLLAGMIEFAVRRRNDALALYAMEHQQAETLQRSLLPSLPELPGLDLAARYEAGGVGQQVGGDWFDVFALSGGGVAFAIGDVMGHDLAAAAAMSQVRAALRAYGFHGSPPADVLTRLDNFVMTFELTQLVSVFYGVFSPAACDGTRTMRFANAGHLPPLLQGPDGTVISLGDGRSVVIGVPFVEARAEASHVVQPGSTLLMFTDGLLEAPDRSLAETIPALERTVAGHPPASGPDALCDRVLEARADKTGRDDTALLALRLTPMSTDRTTKVPSTRTQGSRT